MTPEQTSLEVKIGKLETKMDFVIEKLDDLEKGLVSRVEKVESGKFPSIDFVQFRNNEFIPYQKKVDDLWDLRWKIIALAFLGGVIGGFLLKFIYKKLGI